ncbi:MAG: N-acetyl-gamma-glutamyl-phosphate reductase [Clostridia bacterium]|nr:N-acetyl-gamma-glutamyl-phosphate reductase [Clostridia bacterium]
MKKKVFIDGSEGTTGLRINERFENRDDIELLKIDPELRKDPVEIKKLINASDITFLCLPDAAAREAVALAENEETCIIDTSTAHRTDPEWAYGFAELSKEHRDHIAKGKRIAVPGCHATGLISVLYPVIAGKILNPDYPVGAFSITGYSGGGKKMIAQYEDENREQQFDAPREYALSQEHKHLKEMKAVTGITRLPLFSPIVADYYSGMVVSMPIYTDLMNQKMTAKELRDYFAQYYQNEAFIKVMPYGAEAENSGFLSGISCTGWDGLRIYITGNEDRIVMSSQFDNLGKGASGAAVQCMNIKLGCEESKGLNL